MLHLGCCSSPRSASESYLEMKYGECPYLQERGVTLSNDTLCTTWYYLDNLKKVKNTHGVVLLLVKMQVYACNFTKVTIPHACFSRFLTFTNDTNLHKASQILTRNSNLKLKLYLSLISCKQRKQNIKFADPVKE